VINKKTYILQMLNLKIDKVVDKKICILQMLNFKIEK